MATKTPTISTILFDCDNTLVLTEHLAFQACARLANEILKSHKISRDEYTGPELMGEFVGKNFRGMMEGLQEKNNFTMTEEELSSYVNREVGEVISVLKEQGQECEGALAQVKWAEKAGYKMAVVSSSAGPRVEASVNKVEMGGHFPKKLIFSAATSLPEGPTSKPNPRVYLYAMEQLGNLRADRCIAVEDSVSGSGAAVAAKLRTIAYVGAYHPKEQQEVERKLMDNGCKIVMKHWKDFPKVLEDLDKMST